MASVNKVILIGHLGADPEKRYTQAGMAICNLRVATSEVSGKGDDRKETTEWHKCVCFAKTAENAATYLRKGAGVYVEGRLHTNAYDDKDGVKRYSTEIVVNELKFLDRKGGDGPRDREDRVDTPSSAAMEEAAQVGAPTKPDDDDQFPF
jgi:single-strand DNA-binding protein